MIRRLVISFLLFSHALLWAQDVRLAEEEIPSRYIARIELHTAAELMDSLKRADMLQQQGEFIVGEDEPIAFILHGPEARVLFMNHYTENKVIIDLAARLTAFRVVDIKVCETWMGSQTLDTSQLPPFIGTVPYGPSEAARLLEQEHYVYF